MQDIVNRNNFVSSLKESLDCNAVICSIMEECVVCLNNKPRYSAIIIVPGSINVFGEQPQTAVNWPSVLVHYSACITSQWKLLTFVPLSIC